MFSRDTAAADIMESPLADFPGWHFWVECRACGKATQVFCDHVARRFGKGLAVADVVARLRCRRCRGMPTRVTMADRMPGMGRSEPVIEIVLTA